MWPSRIERVSSAMGSVHIVAFHQHRVERGDRALVVHADALHELRQRGEHTRRIASARRRLAGGQADLALGPRKARHRVHQEQHALALVAEVFGDRRRHVRGLSAFHRRLVGRRADDDGLAPPLLAPARVREIPALRDRARRSARTTVTSTSAPFTSMPMSVDLPPPAAAKIPMRWPSPHVEQAVERAHAERQRLVDQPSLQWIR